MNKFHMKELSDIFEGIEKLNKNKTKFNETILTEEGIYVFVRYVVENYAQEAAFHSADLGDLRNKAVKFFVKALNKIQDEEMIFQDNYEIKYQKTEKRKKQEKFELPKVNLDIYSPGKEYA